MIRTLKSKGIDMKLVLIALFFQLLLSWTGFSQESNKATVTKLRGRVIASLPSGKEISLKKGDKIPPKSKIKSQSKSFAIITFSDKTKLTLGPNSEMEIKAPSTKGEPGLINLLKGQLRSKVKPDKKRKGNKLVISSRAAAIGVRGTETVITYNPYNNSLTTGGMTGLVVISPPLAELTVAAANAALNDRNPNTYKLPAAHFSSVKFDDGKIRVSAPRKLNPIQLNLLRKNPEPTFEKVSITSSNNENKRSATLPNLSIVKQHDPINDSTDKGSLPKGNAQMPAGSFIDLKTGALIPPPPGSEYDANTGTFIVSSKFGTVASNGEYMPPPGVELNERGEFVAAESSGRGVASSTRTGSEGTIAEMNQVVEISLNAESIYLNPDSNTVKNEGLETRREARDERSETIQDQALQNVIASAAADISQTDDQAVVDTTNSCPGNICDKFDTVAPMSDEATNKTMVQFRIRVNNN